MSKLGAVLWSAHVSDTDRTVTLEVATASGRLVSLTVTDDDGVRFVTTGIALTRSDAQAIRNALTSWLIDVGMGDIEP